MVFRLEYLPIARRDMVEIVQYISRELYNPSAAAKLATEFIESTDRLSQYPYSNKIYTPIRPLEHEYRKLLVQNYIMFYWIDEQRKVITIARVVYARRDYDKLL